MIVREVYVPMRVTSMNKLKGRHWSVYQKQEKNRWAHALGHMLGRGEHSHLRRFIQIISCHENRKGFYDPDNHKLGCKPILDTLKDLGWIFDDKGEWAEVDYDQVCRRDEGQAEVGTKIILYAPGYSPGVYICEACLKTALPAPLTETPLYKSEPCTGGAESCVFCHGPCVWFVRLVVWRTANVKQKTKKRSKKT